MIHYLRNTRYKQCIAALAASMAVASMSCYGAWPSPVMPQLQGENSPIGETITTEQGSWIVAVYILSGLPTAPFTALLCEKIGRRGTLIVGSLFLFFPWLLTIFSPNYWSIFAAKLLGGIGTMLSIPTSIVYNSEIADPDIRGMVTTTYSWMKLLGNFVVLSIGPFVHYTTLSAICAVFPAVLFLLMLLMPETPYYLVKTERKEKASAALKFLAAANASDGEIAEKLAKIEGMIQEDRSRNKITLRGFLMGRQYRSLIFIAFLLMTLDKACGYIAVKSYLQTIIQQTTSSLAPKYSSIAFGAIEFPAALTSSLLIDRVGRKPLLITSSLGCALALASEGIYFYLQDQTQQDLSSLAWLPTTAIALFIYFVNIGVLNITVLMVGEIFPSNLKGTAVPLFTLYATSLSFLVAKTFAPSYEAWGVFTMFWIYATCCFIGALMVHLTVPETKGKSFAEIQDIINPTAREKGPMDGKNLEEK